MWLYPCSRRDLAMRAKISETNNDAITRATRVINREGWWIPGQVEAGVRHEDRGN